MRFLTKVPVARDLSYVPKTWAETQTLLQQERRRVSALGAALCARLWLAASS